MSGINVAFVSSGNINNILLTVQYFALVNIPHTLSSFVNSLNTLFSLFSSRESQGRLDVSLGSPGCGQAAEDSRALTRVLMARGGSGSNRLSLVNTHNTLFSLASAPVSAALARPLTRG